MANAFEYESLRGDLRHGHRDKVVNKHGTILNEAYINVWYAMDGVDNLHARYNDSYGIGQREQIGRAETQKLRKHFLACRIYINPRESPIHTTSSRTVQKTLTQTKTRVTCTEEVIINLNLTHRLHIGDHHLHHFYIFIFLCSMLTTRGFLAG